MIQSIITYFYGSTPDDFDQTQAPTPFEPCPDSPNCTYYSAHYHQEPNRLFEEIREVLEKISPYKLDSDSQSLQIDAVFRIPVFGFKDDVKIIIKPDESNGSFLHIKSSSRTGESDLGVNRRRIKQILSQLNQQIL